MRLRQAAVTTVGVLALLLSAPTPASAATGDFLYKVGPGIPAGLADPRSGECINVFGATQADPAFAPENFTRSTATVFLDFECDGDVFYTMNPGKKLGNRLHFRSVLFS
ncbi:hypothetical protein ACFVVX_19170 [Kitasatospora sp. NPDC058170]|uniref:hypothetical protein n=1 Tax=Kitasatospora sp. NPDC058170 TaxID=3346364 RepID=UPI0036D89D5F